jgi:hypothetical protein
MKLPTILLWKIAFIEFILKKHKIDGFTTKGVSPLKNPAP